MDGGAITAERQTVKKRRRRSRRRGRRKPNPLLAVVDLGTNNCRLLVARARKNGEFHVVDSFSRIVRLGEGVAQSGALSEAAIARTIAALKVCAQRIARHKTTRVRAIATEACRRASNASDLVERAKKETGLALSIVSTEEEARLAAIGCAPLIGGDYEGALVFDIGGGSTEIIWLGAKDGAMRFARSVPVGVVTLAEEMGHGADGRDYEKMRKAMRALFQPVCDAMEKEGAFATKSHHLLGTSGTVTTLAGIAMNLPRYVRNRVDASWHDCGTILSVVDRLVALDIPARTRVGCIGAERADLIVPGCAIFAAIHELWPCARLRVADRGLREGMLRELAGMTA